MSASTPFRPTRRSLAALAFGAALLTSPLATAADPVTVRVGFIPVLGSAPIFVAAGEGWGKEAGLDIKLTQFESGPNIVPALASGTIDVYVAGIAPVAVARSKGLDVRVVTATATEEAAFVAGPKLAAALKGAKTPAEGFAAFAKAEGKPARLATQPAGSVPNTVLQHWLWEVVKADKTTAEPVAMGIEATQQALLAGAVDGGVVREPAITILRDRNPGIELVALGGQLFKDQPGGVVAVTGAFADKYPKETQALVSAIVRAVGLLKTDPDRAAVHVTAVLGKGIVDQATMKRALISPASRFVADPRIIVEPVKAMQDYQVKLGSLDKPVPLDGLFVSTYFEKAASSQ